MKNLNEAALGTRTRNLLITDQLLCQLSYDGKSDGSGNVFAPLPPYCMIIEYHIDLSRDYQSFILFSYLTANKIFSFVHNKCYGYTEYSL